jgi:hypothetical protein
LDVNSRLRLFKRVADGFADDLDDFAARLEAETPIFKKLVTTGADALARAAPIMLDLGPEAKHSLEGSLPAIRAAATAFAAPSTVLQGFKETISRWPGISTKLIQSRNRLTTVVDALIDTSDGARQQILNLVDTLEKLARG